MQQRVLAVRAPGRYELALRLDRASPHPATCLARMAFGRSRVTSEVGVDLTAALVCLLENAAVRLFFF